MQKSTGKLANWDERRVSVREKKRIDRIERT